MSTDSEPRRIGLFGNFGTGNLGNEATLQAMVCNVRSRVPNAEITCICPCPEKTAPRYHISAAAIRATLSIKKIIGLARKERCETGRSLDTTSEISLMDRWFKSLAWLKPLLLVPYRWFRAITFLKGSDALVMTGTGMLGDFGIRPFGLHYDILAWSFLARLCGCKLLFVSVGAGPIRHPVSRCFAKAALTLAHYRSYRDDFSKRYLEGIGFDVSADMVYPDLAFSLPRTMLAESHERHVQGVVVGVGLMNYFDRCDRSRNNDGLIHRRYVAKLADLVVRLVETGFTVRLLIGDVGFDKGVRRDLRELLEERGLKYEVGKIIDEPASSVDELMSQLASTDVVVASRYHNLLLALMLSKPVLAISYHEKFQPLMAGVGLAEFCEDIEHIDVESAIAKLIRLQENAQQLKPQIARMTDTYRMALDEQYDRIFKRI